MQFRREEEENFSLDLTPLIDVVFLLLIFFMVSTVFVDFKRRMDISLPSSKSAVLDEVPKTLNIEITTDRQIFLNEKKVSLRKLESALASLPDAEKKNAIIRADKNLPYGEVIKVMGILQSASVLDISVAVK
ncbi:MAG: biopolymer transporter ExbD [Nitrospinaceae bacterium]